MMPVMPVMGGDTVVNNSIYFEGFDSYVLPNTLIPSQAQSFTIKSDNAPLLNLPVTSIYSLKNSSTKSPWWGDVADAINESVDGWSMNLVGDVLADQEGAPTWEFKYLGAEPDTLTIERTNSDTLFDPDPFKESL